MEETLREASEGSVYTSESGDTGSFYNDVEFLQGRPVKTRTER